MNGLSFGNPAMWWGIGLLAVPWLIHWWNRRRFEDEPWGAMPFLLAAYRRRSHRVRLENVLLLLLRCLAVALIVAAFTDPRLVPQQASASPSNRPRTLHLIVLDASYSMLASRDGTTNWERAISAIRDVVSGARRGDGFSLLLMGHSPQRIVWRPSFDRDTFMTQVESVRAEHGGADLEGVTGVVEEWLRAVRGTGFHFEYRVHWISDLESSTWEPASGARLQRRWRELARRATLVLHALPAIRGPNHYLRPLTTDRPVGIVGEEIEVTAEVVNGEAAARRIEVAFYDHGQLVDRAPVDVPPRGRAGVSLRLPVSRAADMEIEARLPDDALQVDNHQYLLIPVRRALRVLCIEGMAGDAKALEGALDPQRNRRPLDVVRADESGSWGSSLTDYDQVWLVNVRRLDRARQMALDAYVRQGGGVVIAVGDRTDMAAWRDALAADGALSPGKLKGLAGPGEFHPDVREFRHPIIDVFRGNAQSGLATLPVWTYWRVEPADDAIPVLPLDTGDPLMLERHVGAGRVIWILTSIDPRTTDRRADPPAPWSAMALWPTFVPLMQETAFAASAGWQERRNVAVHDPMRGRLPVHRGRPRAHLVLPDGKRERVEPVPDEWGWTWEYDRVDRSGWYRLELVDRAGADVVMAAHVVPAESRLQRFDRNRLAAFFVRPAELSPPSAGVPSRPFRWFRYLLAAGLILLLADMLLATGMSKEGEFA